MIRLDGRSSSIVIDAGGAGVPRICHWGRRLPDGLDLDILPTALSRPLPRSHLDRLAPLTLFPTFGLGWFNQPALRGGRGRQDWAADFACAGHERTAAGVIFHCRDATVGLELALELALDPVTDVLSLCTVLRNTGADDYRLDGCAAAVLPLPTRCTEALVFTGQWAQEFQEQRIALVPGVWSRENRRGRTSHDTFPSLIAGTSGFAEDRGEVYGFHLGWSGNHRLLVERLDDGAYQVQFGEWLAPGEVVLDTGEAYRSPTVYAAYSDAGLNPLSDRFHRYVRGNVLAWPGGTMTPRPVMLNTWEALYFDHDLERLQALAQAAADLGVERFVLDDGWFRGRDHDRAGLGDWTPDPRKYPHGLSPLIDFVIDRGMQFGLWVEPEMVNPDSDLYRRHPDWVLRLAGRQPITGRHQLVLDLTRADVGDYLYGALDTLVRKHPIAYLKWDMNRDLAPAASDGAPAYRRQTQALYALLDRLRAAHPGVEIETCASGGGRADYGILAHTQRVWASDNNDALERQAIQCGFSRFFPPEVMGAHIGPSPAHVSGRRHTLALRAATALFGHLGLELDVLALEPAERIELKAWIETYKRFRTLLHSGRGYRLGGLDGSRGGHGVVALDRGEALFAIVQREASPLRIPAPVALPGLEPLAIYRLALAGPLPPLLGFDSVGLQALKDGVLQMAGAVLAGVGLQTPILPPETALLVHCTRVQHG